MRTLDGLKHKSRQKPKHANIKTQQNETKHLVPTASDPRPPRAISTGSKRQHPTLRSALGNCTGTLQGTTRRPLWGGQCQRQSADSLPLRSDYGAWTIALPESD